MLSIHFDKHLVNPGAAYWSLTVYGINDFRQASSLNCFRMGEKDELEYNEDGSLDILIQKENPGKDKEQNWLPSPTGQFFLVMRLFWPDEASLQLMRDDKGHSDLL